MGELDFRCTQRMGRSHDGSPENDSLRQRSSTVRAPILDSEEAVAYIENCDLTPANIEPAFHIIGMAARNWACRHEITPPTT